MKIIIEIDINNILLDFKFKKCNYYNIRYLTKTYKNTFILKYYKLIVISFQMFAL